jgi:hypothetical protein
MHMTFLCALFETVSLCAQVGSVFLGSTDPPALASSVTGMTSERHHVQPGDVLKSRYNLMAAMLASGQG